jgi:hypothetical protein
MLGGGLLHPLVSFALAMHFTPNFGSSFGEEGVPRFVAMHSAPGADLDKLRQFELDHMGVARSVLGLERITCNLLDLLSGLRAALIAAARRDSDAA